MKYLECALFLAGAALLGVLVAETGWERLFADLSLIGWGFVLVFAQEVLAYAANTIGWACATEPSKRRVPFTRLLAYRLAGDGINHLTPTATIGGEFVRARLLGLHIGIGEATASVTIAKFAETVGQLLFIAGGLAAVLPFLPGLGPHRWSVLGIVVGASAGIVWLGRLLDRGFFTHAARRLSSWGIAGKWFERHAGQIAAVDARVRHCARNRPRDLALSVFWYMAAWATSTIEVWLILRLMGLPAPWHIVLGVEVLSVLIDGVLFFVPAKMGTQEGGKMVVFSILGLPAAEGLAMGLVRRSRELLWAFFGLLVYSLIRCRVPQAEPFPAEAPKPVQE